MFCLLLMNRVVLMNNGFLPGSSRLAGRYWPLSHIAKRPPMQAVVIITFTGRAARRKQKHPTRTEGHICKSTNKPANSRLTSLE